jgi:hypothetical protein
MIEDTDSKPPAPTHEVEPVEDCELLRRYAVNGSEEAFAELVRRRIGLVYSVALRQARGDRHRAEDATTGLGLQWYKGESDQEQWIPVDNERVTLRIPQASAVAVLSVYERTSEKMIIRDPSIGGILTTVDLQTPPSNRVELIRTLRDTLRDQFNVILEPTAEGSLLAKRGPAQ